MMVYSLSPNSIQNKICMFEKLNATTNQTSNSQRISFDGSLSRKQNYNGSTNVTREMIFDKQRAATKKQTAEGLISIKSTGQKQSSQPERSHHALAFRNVQNTGNTSDSANKAEDGMNSSCHQHLLDITNKNRESRRKEEITDIQSQIESLRTATSNLKKRLPAENLSSGIARRRVKKLKALDSYSELMNDSKLETKTRHHHSWMNESKKENNCLFVATNKNNVPQDLKLIPIPIAVLDRKTIDKDVTPECKNLIMESNDASPESENQQNMIPKSEKRTYDELMDGKTMNEAIRLQSSEENRTTPRTRLVKAENYTIIRTTPQKKLIKKESPIKFKRSASQKLVSSQYSLSGNSDSNFVQSETSSTRRKSISELVHGFNSLSNFNQSNLNYGTKDKFLDSNPQTGALSDADDQDSPAFTKEEDKSLQAYEKELDFPAFKAQEIPAVLDCNTKEAKNPQKTKTISNISEPKAPSLENGTPPKDIGQDSPKKQGNHLKDEFFQTPKKVMSFPEISKPGSSVKSSAHLQILMFSPIDEIKPIRANKGGKKRKTLKRFWEVIYAALAILELTTCSQTIMIANKTTHIEVCSAVEVPPFAVTSVTQTLCETNLGQQDEKMSKKKEKIKKKNIALTNDFLDNVYRPMLQEEWQEWINAAFIFAVIVHISLESWSIATSNSEKKRHKEEAEAKLTLVTGRSFKRRTALDESSFNRHFIRKWSRNRIKWSRTTTDIAKAAALLVVLQLLAIPILRGSGPLAKTKKKLIKRLLPSLKKKKSSKLAAAASSTSFSLGEILLMKVSSWCQSNGVKALKRALFKMIRAVIFRPKKINKIFTWIRWTKFVAPLVGASNKLRGNWIDLMKKRDQRRYRNQLRKVVNNESHRTIRAISKFQAKFRALRTRNGYYEGKQRVLGMFSSTSNSKSRRLRKDHSKNFRQKKLKFLLRPNTTFSVGWKVITVSCVFLELLNKLLSAPNLPTKVIAVNDLLKILLAPSVAYIVRLVSFLDVFLSFFTGELDSRTGQLVPKPFFSRYFLPGLGLQLLVNPTLKDISKVVMAFFTWSLRVGPSRMLHIVVALKPLIRELIHWSVELLFLFVAAWNRLPRKRGVDGLKEALK